MLFFSFLPHRLIVFPFRRVRFFTLAPARLLTRVNFFRSAFLFDCLTGRRLQAAKKDAVQPFACQIVFHFSFAFRSDPFSPLAPSGQVFEVLYCLESMEIIKNWMQKDAVKRGRKLISPFFAIFPAHSIRKLCPHVPYAREIRKFSNQMTLPCMWLFHLQLQMMT